MADVIIDLPPGFRFHPRDEEIIAHYLFPKVMNSEFSSAAIGDADLNRTEPWDLPSKAKVGEEEWYFFSWRDRKYPTGTRTNRATEAGYWKATGKDKEIFGRKGVLIGMKKTLVFYKGRAPKGEKTNWVMHEFRLDGKSYANLPKTAQDEWAVCKVYNKSPMVVSGLASMSQFGENLVESDILPPLMESPSGNFNFFSGILENGQDTNGSFFSDINSQLPNSAYCSQIKPETAYFSSPDVVTSMGYLHQDQTNGYGLAAAIKKHCIKGEQFSTHSTMSASQDTSIDISSKNMGSSYNDSEFFAGQAIDLDGLWKF